MPYTRSWPCYTCSPGMLVHTPTASKRGQHMTQQLHTAHALARTRARCRPRQQVGNGARAACCDGGKNKQGVLSTRLRVCTCTYRDSRTDPCWADISQHRTLVRRGRAHMAGSALCASERVVAWVTDAPGQALLRPVDGLAVPAAHKPHEAPHPEVEKVPIGQTRATERRKLGCMSYNSAASTRAYGLNNAPRQPPLQLLPNVPAPQLHEQEPASVAD
jgi:hypothetical protein